MKKIVSIFFAALIALGAVVPIVQVAEAEEGDITWEYYDCAGDDCPEGYIEGELEYSWNGAGGYTAVHILQVDIICEGVDCEQNYDVYYEISGTLAWNKSSGYPVTEYFANAKISPVPATIDHLFYCWDDGYNGVCQYQYYGMISGEALGSTTISVDIGYPCTSPSYCSSQNDVTVKLSGTGIDTDDCEDYADQEEIASGTLDPTNEEGDYIELVAGELYRVSISGGPWNDGSTDRYDAAVKNGEEDWQGVGGFVQEEDAGIECVQNDPEDFNAISWVMEAQDGDFRIRVNDLPGAFADNTGSLDYAITTVVFEPGLSDCSDSFLITGDPIYSGTIAASDSIGETAFTKDLMGRPTTGDFIAIEFDGVWKNNGAGLSIQNMEMKIGTGAWISLDTVAGTICYDPAMDSVGYPHGIYYMQVTSPLTHYLRVDDNDGNFAANTGTVDYTVYETIYSPPSNGCGLNYSVGDYVGMVTAMASSSSGAEFEFPFDAVAMNGAADEMLVFAIETSGSYLDGSLPQVAGGIELLDMSPTWEPLETYSEALCVETLDPVGHVRVYIAVDPAEARYKFRAEDAVSYSDNTGTLGFRISQATYLLDDTPPVGDPCGDMYSRGSLIETIVLDAELPYYYLDMLQSDSYYAIETTDGPWTDDGAFSYQVAMAAVGVGLGPLVIGYTELSAFALCTQESEDIYQTAFIYAQEGYKYYIRVNDEVLDLGDNAGSITIRIYQATNEADTWETCADAYTLSRMDTDPAIAVVPGNQESGARVAYIQTGGFYALEITGDDVWSDPDVIGSYDAEICEMGPAGCQEDDWYPLNDADDAGIAVCVVTVLSTTSPARYRIYFDVMGPFYIRVGDSDGNFEENSGRLTYILYGATDPNGTPGVPGDDPGAPPWEVACYSGCLRPDGLLVNVAVNFGTLGSVTLPVPNVGGWISYMTCTVVSYFTWCPQHTEMLDNIGDLADDIEPIATINDMTDFVTRSVTTLKSITPYIAGETAFDPNGIGGASLGDMNAPPGVNQVPPAYPALLFPDMQGENSPWFGGQLDLTSTTVEDPYKQEYIDTCTIAYRAYVGESQADMLCQLHHMIGHTSFFVALLTIMDAAILFFLVFKYLPRYIKRWINLFSNRSNAGILG